MDIECDVSLFNRIAIWKTTRDWRGQAVQLEAWQKLNHADIAQATMH